MKGTKTATLRYWLSPLVTPHCGRSGCHERVTDQLWERRSGGVPILVGDYCPVHATEALDAHKEDAAQRGSGG